MAIPAGIHTSETVRASAARVRKVEPVYITRNKSRFVFEVGDGVRAESNQKLF